MAENKLKVCNGTCGEHAQGDELPLDAFYKNAAQADGLSPQCKKCINAYHKRAKEKKKQTEAIRQWEFQEAEMPVTKEDLDAAGLITKLGTGEATIDPVFLLTEAVKLYFKTGRIGDQIKLLELMAKYSPGMKDAKPQDKKALMASLVESLKQERKTDGFKVVVQANNGDVGGQRDSNGVAED